MRRFKSASRAQRFLALHAWVHNLFRYCRHLFRAANHRLLRGRAFDVWRSGVMRLTEYLDSFRLLAT